MFTRGTRPAILKYVTWVLENNFPASQQRLEVFRDTHLLCLGGAFFIKNII